MVNFHNCHGGREDHPEFRVFDATLDPGAIQAQIKIAVASTAAAERIAAAGGTSRGQEPWGAHAQRIALLDAARRLPALIGHDIPGQIAKAGRRLDLHPVPADFAVWRERALARGAA